MDLQLGYWRWKIYRWHDHPNPFRGRNDLALEWLRRHYGNRAAVAELRGLLNGSGNPSRADNTILEEVARRLSAGELHLCGEYCGTMNTATADFVEAPAEAAVPLELFQKQPAQAAAQDTAPPDTAPSSTPSTAAAPASSTSTADPVTEPTAQTEPSTLAKNTDPEAMAQVLKQAAQDGAPFCEECAKAAETQAEQAAQNTAAKAAAPVETEIEADEPGSPTQQIDPESAVPVPEHLDAEAMAATLKEAAKVGAPFCVECAKAAASQATQATQAAQAVQRRGSPARNPANDLWIVDPPAAAPDAALPPERPGPILPGTTFPANLDAIAVAAVLTEASAQGKPFCVECLKARLSKGV